MRTFKVSDQMYEQLKTFIVDPFDDTPELVIGRLIEIVNKAKARWAPFEAPEAAAREAAAHEAPPEMEPLPRPRRREQEMRRELEIPDENGAAVLL